MSPAVPEGTKVSNLASWDQLVRDAVQEPDPVLSNLKVTRAHYLLSEALRDATGPEAGANFHSWAVWGSRKAGVTIREEGLDRALREVTLLSLCTGLLTGFLLGVALSWWLPWGAVLALSALGAVCGTAVGRRWLVLGRRRAAELMLAGNRTVLEDIGGQTARFLCWLAEADSHDAQSFSRFLDGFRPGIGADGQELLRRAFTQYYQAVRAEDIDHKRQATYFANCLAICHEHLRLQPYISGSLPWIVRRCVTYRLMRFDVGPLRLAVGDDVPSLDGLDFPESLRQLTDPALVQLLYGKYGDGLAGAENSLSGTAARDWTHFAQRMRYIVNLFRALHLHPDVCSPPYTPKQVAHIQTGRIPPGPL